MKRISGSEQNWMMVHILSIQALVAFSTVMLQLLNGGFYWWLNDE